MITEFACQNSLGETLWYGGYLVEAEEYLKQSIDFYDSVQHHSLTALYGTDPITGSMIYRAICLWFLGYRDQCLRLADEALDRAPTLHHLFSVAFIKVHTTIAYHALDKPQEVQRRAEETISLSTEYGFAFYRALSTILKGWALVKQGDAKGITYTEAGWKEYQAIEVGVGRTWALALVADTSGLLGRLEEGLEAIRAALDIVDHTGEQFYEAELYRLKGELTLQKFQVSGSKFQVPPDPQTEAEACFLKAIEIAHRQQAKSLELRAVVSLARLWQQQGKSTEARKMLTEIYSWFTEGFDTADLQEAKALLEELGGC